MAIFDITYVGDMPYLKLEGGTVTGATIFNSSIAANSGSITNNLAVGSINGVTVGQSPKFTDTTYSVATTSVAGLMSTTDKTAVDKVGTGTLNTTNKTIIPAINELKSTDSNLTTRITTIENKINTTPSTAPPEIRGVYVAPTEAYANADGWSYRSNPMTITIPGVVGDTVIIFAFSFNGSSNSGTNRTATTPSGYTLVSGASRESGVYNWAQYCFMKYKTATSETVTITFSGGSHSSDDFYSDYAVAIVIKGRYNIEIARAFRTQTDYQKPHQGFYLYAGRNALTYYSNNPIPQGITSIEKTSVYFDNDSVARKVSLGTNTMAICLKISGDWNGSELPVGAYFATQSTNKNPNEILGYGSWQRNSSFTPYWWERTS